MISPKKGEEREEVCARQKEGHTPRPEAGQCTAQSRGWKSGAVGTVCQVAEDQGDQL